MAHRNAHKANTEGLVVGRLELHEILITVWLPGIRRGADPVVKQNSVMAFNSFKS
jgi:hypothetical protein